MMCGGLFMSVCVHEPLFESQPLAFEVIPDLVLGHYQDYCYLGWFGGSSQRWWLEQANGRRPADCSQPVKGQSS